MASPPKPNVRVNVRIGRNSETLDATDRRVGDAVANATIGQATDNSISNRLLDLQKLRSTLPQVIEREYASGINWAVKNMIGTPSPRGAGSAHIFRSLGNVNAISDWKNVDLFTAAEDRTIQQPAGRLLWHSLSGRAIREKMTKHKVDYKTASQFFVDEGHLRTKLAKMAREIVRRTGSTKIVVTAKPLRDARGRFVKRTRIAVGSLTIKLMPSVPRSLLPGLGAKSFGVVDHMQGFEALVVRDPEVRKKLFGSGAVHSDTKYQRPMLQPIFTYWTQYYIPARIAQTLRKVTRTS